MAVHELTGIRIGPPYVFQPFTPLVEPPLADDPPPYRTPDNGTLNLWNSDPATSTTIRAFRHPNPNTGSLRFHADFVTAAARNITAQTVGVVASTLALKISGIKITASHPGVSLYMFLCANYSDANPPTQYCGPNNSSGWMPLRSIHPVTGAVSFYTYPDHGDTAPGTSESIWLTQASMATWAPNYWWSLIGSAENGTLGIGFMINEWTGASAFSSPFVPAVNVTIHSAQYNFRYEGEAPGPDPDTDPPPDPPPPTARTRWPGPKARLYPRDDSPARIYPTPTSTQIPGRLYPGYR